MFKHFNTQIRSIYIVTCSILLLLLLVSPIASVKAGDLPDKGQLTEQITNDAHNKVVDSLSKGSDSKSSSNNDNQSESNQPSESDSGSDITNTGNNVNTEQNDESQTDVGVQNNNDAVIDQTINATANTGNNTANGNISFGGNAGVINTGNASVNTSSSASANNSQTSVGVGSGGSGGSGSSVTNTGNKVSSASNSDSKTTTIVGNNNTVTINQNTNASANTGGNVADGNISFGGSAGVINTGNASVNTASMVIANSNRTVAVVGGDGSGGPGSGASIHILNTGSNSNYLGMSRYTQTAQVNNNNDANVSQTANLSANTGGNSSNGGIAFGGNAGVIKTGNAVVNVGLWAVANSNNTLVSLGGAVGNLLGLDVVNTGNNSNFSQDNSSDTNVGVNNNNNARVNQVVNANANTGNNTANGNISFGGDAGVITTGDAEVNICLVADVNSSETTVSINNDAGVMPVAEANPAPAPANPTGNSGATGSTTTTTVSLASTNTTTSGPTGKSSSSQTELTVNSEYYDPASIEAEVAQEVESHPVLSKISQVLGSIAEAGEILADASGPTSPEFASIRTQTEEPNFARVLKGLMLISFGYGIAMARYKLPRFVGNK